MILPVVVVGCPCAAAVGLIYRIGLLADRSGFVVLVCAIAALTANAWGFHAGVVVLAGLLVAHGLFDSFVIVISTPAPDWWAPFCAGVDIAAGAALLILMRRKDISV
jgi:hypothetical protein